MFQEIPNRPTHVQPPPQLEKKLDDIIEYIKLINQNLAAITMDLEKLKQPPAKEESKESTAPLLIFEEPKKNDVDSADISLSDEDF